MAISESSSRYSLLALFIILVGITFVRFNLPRLKVDGYSREITYDVTCYYLPLPMTFIYHDPAMKNKATLDSIWKKYEPSPTMYQLFELENGNRVVTYLLGLTYFQAPFFFMGDLIAKIGHYPRDGFSVPYQFSLAAGFLIYVIIGWIFLRKVLLHFLDDRFAALTMILICYGTNYFSEAINNYLQPHTTLFSLYAVFLYLVIKWHKTPTKKNAAALGVVMGWLVITRPSEIVSIFIPLLWGVYNKETWMVKWELIKTYKSHLLVLIGSAFVLYIPQFIYWYTVTGSPVFFSYQRTEGFDFLRPHLWNVLFSFKKSLIIYTPMFIFIIIGLFRLRKNYAPVSLAIVTYALVNFYLLGSWGAWWNDGSFGMRFFAQSHAVMSIPLGLLMVDLSNQRTWIKSFATVCISFFVFLNLFQTWQYLNWIIPDNRMNFAYYKASFLKTSKPENAENIMEVRRSYGPDDVFLSDDYNPPKLIAYFDFDGLNSEWIDHNLCDTTVRHSGNYSCRLAENNMYYPNFNIRYNQLIPEDRDHVWIRVSCWYYATVDLKSNMTSIVINLRHGKFDTKYRAYNLGEKDFKLNEWNYAEFYYITPFPNDESDVFQIYGWYHGKGEPVYIDDFKVEAFVRKF